MESCIAAILCMWAEPYGGYVDPICQNPQEIVQLIELSGTEVPSKYSLSGCDPRDLHGAHDFLINTTQESFFARKADQERWNTKIPKWIIDNQHDILTKVAQASIL